MAASSHRRGADSDMGAAFVALTVAGQQRNFLGRTKDDARRMTCLSSLRPSPSGVTSFSYFRLRLVGFSYFYLLSMPVEFFSSERRKSMGTLTQLSIGWPPLRAGWKRQRLIASVAAWSSASLPELLLIFTCFERP